MEADLSQNAAKDCWVKDPRKKPGASSTPKPAAKPKAKPAAKSRGSKGRGKGLEKEENFEKLKKAKSLQKLRSLKNQRESRRVIKLPKGNGLEPKNKKGR